MAVEYNFTLDMDRSKRDNNIAYARTGDLDSIVINADLVFNGAAYTPTGANAFFECVTPNGCSVRAAAEKTGSSVSVEVPSAAFQAAGVINVAYFRFETGDTASPSYVESTEPFAIVVREGIGDNIDTGDYIEGWRLLADQIEALKDDVEQKAEQAKTAISEQKEEVDELKSQAQIEIAGDVTTIESAKTQAISDINGYKADVANAAEGITEAGEQAISQFNTSSQQAINSFNTKGESAVGQFNTNGTSAINQFNTNADNKLDEVDGMITEAQGDVNAAITQLETATSQAVDAMEDALEGTTAGSLQNAINRALKLDIADMTNIPDNASLSSFTNVGSYCCKTASTAATIGDAPIDDGPFNMYVFSSSTSGQVMQLVVPIDLQGKPTAEWHVRFGTSSAMDTWSVIGGGADIAAGLGIDVTGDAQKTISLDTTSFYEHVGPSNIVSGSTEVTGGGRFKEIRIKGQTVNNLWPSINISHGGVTVSTDDTGLITVSGTASGSDISVISEKCYSLKPLTNYVVSCDKPILATGGSSCFSIYEYDSNDSNIAYYDFAYSNGSNPTTVTFTTAADVAYVKARLFVVANTTVSGTYRVMFVEGTEAPDFFTPIGIHGVEPENLVVAGKNFNDIAQQIEQVGWSSSAKPGWYGTRTELLALFNSLPEGEYVLSCKCHVDSVSPESTADPNSGNVAGFIVRSSDNTIYPCIDRITVGVTHVGDTLEIVHPVEISPETCMGRYDQLYVYSPGIDLGYRSISTFYDIQLELGSTATDYEPPSVTEVALPETDPLMDGDTLIISQDGSASVARADETVDHLGTVALPALPAPTFNAYMSGGYIQGEIEGDVVKVDYLSPSDTYTREEVDKKMEDAGSMPDVVPVSQGGTGVTTAAAERNRLGLGNTTGALPVANGGTGATTAKAAQNALLNDITAEDGSPEDSSLFTFAYVSPSSANGVLYKRTGSNVWNWIVSKIRSIFGFNSSNVLDVEHGGTGFNDFPAMLVDLSSTSSASPYQNAPRPGVTGILPVSHGGTGSNTPEGVREAIGAGTSNFSGSYNDLTEKPQIPSVPVSVANGGTGGTSASSARTNLDVYSKSEVDGKIPKVVVGSGNIPGDAEEGTIYINYQ